MNTSVVSDQELISQARDGDRHAFRELVDRHEGAVAATVRGMLGNSESARDVGLEVFVRFHRSISSFRGEANLRTYLTRIAINLSLNELKRQSRERKRFSGLDEAEPEDTRKHPDRKIMDQERDAMVRAAITSLDTPFREVVVLRLINGLSVRETASALGVPTGTVLSRLSRAQEKLRVLIKPLLPDYHEYE